MDERRSELRKFGLVVGGGFVVLAAILLLRHRVHATFYVFSSVGGGLVVLGMIAPTVLGPVQRVWMSGAAVLGHVNTRILLTLVYAIIFVPISMLLRLFGRDPLDRRRRADQKTYWRKRPPPPSDEERYQRPF